VKPNYITVTEAVSAPVAGFTASPRVGQPPLSVVFTDTSTGGIDSWSWDFGDGVTDTVQHPTHVYSDTGTFTVSLTVSGPGGADTETKTDYIYVSDQEVIANFSATPTSGEVPLDVQFTGESFGDITDWLWHFGDGVTSTQESPTHTYTSAGAYTVTLDVSGPGGSDTLSRTNYITVTEQPSCTPLTAVEIGGLAEGYVDTSYTFNAAITPTDATLPITYTWMPTPNRGQGTDNAIYAWSIEGTKAITITAKNCDGVVVSDTHDITLAAAESASVTVSPGVSQTLTYTETDGVTTTVEIPSGAVSTTTEIRFTSIPSPTADITSSLRFGNHAFSLDAYREGRLLPDFTFTGTMTVTVHYRDEDVEGIDEETLKLYRYRVSLGWIEVGEEPGEGQDLDVDENVLRAWLRSFSRFGAYGAEVPTFQVYLPLVLRNR
jgi:PKD repeat protein